MREAIENHESVDTETSSATIAARWVNGSTGTASGVWRLVLPSTCRRSTATHQVAGGVAVMITRVASATLRMHWHRHAVQATCDAQRGARQPDRVKRGLLSLPRRQPLVRQGGRRCDNPAHESALAVRTLPPCVIVEQAARLVAERVILKRRGASRGTPAQGPAAVRAHGRQWMHKRLHAPRFPPPPAASASAAAPRPQQRAGSTSKAVMREALSDLFDAETLPPHAERAPARSFRAARASAPRSRGKPRQGDWSIRGVPGRPAWPARRRGSRGRLGSTPSARALWRGPALRARRAWQAGWGLR